MDDFRTHRNLDRTGTQLWAYQNPKAPGVFIIPPPPISLKSYPYAELWRELYGVPNGQHHTGELSGTVSDESSHDSGGQGDTVEAQDEHEGVAGPSSTLSHLARQPGRWMSLRWPKRNGASDQAHDADDSFFIHTNQPLHEPRNEIFFPARVSTPVPVELRPSADYARMMDPSDSEKSTNSYMYKISKFVTRVKGYPWMSSRPTYDYYPGRGHQRFHYDPYADDEWRDMSWYANPGRRSLDLLSSETGHSQPLDSALMYQPELSYGYGDPEVDDLYTASSLGTGHISYPNMYAPPSTVDGTGHSSGPIYGPLIPSDEATYAHSLPWPPPPPIPVDI